MVDTFPTADVARSTAEAKFLRRRSCTSTEDCAIRRATELAFKDKLTDSASADELLLPDTAVPFEDFEGLEWLSLPADVVGCEGRESVPLPCTSGISRDSEAARAAEEATAPAATTAARRRRGILPDAAISAMFKLDVQNGPLVIEWRNPFSQVPADKIPTNFRAIDRPCVAFKDHMDVPPPLSASR